MKSLRPTEIATLAVIPARGGSKGIIRKNLQEVAGISLVGHAIRFAQKSGLFDAIHLSTDDDEIAREGDRYGCKPSFMRSSQASGDRASATEVVREVRNCLLAEGIRVQRYVLLEPTSPMRSVKFVNEAIRLTLKQYNAALTVSPINLKFHADKQFTVSQDRLAEFVTDAGQLVVARQELARTYVRNGFCYVVTDQTIADGKSIFGSRLGAVICDVPFVNIDSQEELLEARRLMGSHQ
jgi:CMP-N,N'-diacetyllegionaminic acid synthase